MSDMSNSELIWINKYELNCLYMYVLRNIVHYVISWMTHYVIQLAVSVIGAGRAKRKKIRMLYTEIIYGVFNLEESKNG